MMLTPQEERAIRLASLRVLSSIWPPAWSPPDGETLAERYPSNPTPECIITNGVMHAAIEVKRLVGDAATLEYSVSREWLFKGLVPTYGGRYTLWPCGGFHLPMSPPVVHMVKSEIERVGKIPRGGEGIVRIERSAEVTCISKSGGPFINCWHVRQTDEVVREVAGSVTGVYCFQDGDLANRWHHSFFTDDVRREFRSRLIDACDRSQEGLPAVVNWNEEWKLTRSGTNTEDGVSVSGVIYGGWVEPGLCEELQRALDQAAVKFWKRWADIHVIILERIEPSNAAEEDVKSVWPRLNLPNVDLILLVDGDRVTTLAARA